ncbi:MAG: hypothetical protein K5776_06770 [Lachnospiraceae bacterium]|nr:hypothetical protein [Lachnospiraceae bacterium]
MFNRNIEEENRIYAGLFDEVKMRQTSDDLKGVSNKAFLGTVELAPRSISFERLASLEGEDFLTGVFFALFQRLPDQKEKEAFKGMDKESILRSLVNKGSFSIRKMEIKDCPYENVKPGIKGKTMGLASSVSSSTALRKLAKKMPAGIQGKIRKLFR